MSVLGTDQLKPIDLAIFREQKDGLAEECKRVVEQLSEYGILMVKDPQVTADVNIKFTEMLESYFSKPDDVKLADSRPDLLYQVGTSPNYIERARPRCEEIAEYDKNQKPLTICPPNADPKWRFFWRIGERPKESEFAQLEAEPVVPKDFPNWSTVMDDWGYKLLAAAHTVAKMAAKGFGMPENTFTDMMVNGPHILAPTGCNLDKYGEKNTIFAHFHKDLDFLTVHGKANYPGLFVWTRAKKKMLVKVPDGCLLVQAGMQFERLTGGKVLAGLHEVVLCDETLERLAERKKQGKSAWRVSSTFFSHIANDQYLEPLAPFEKDETKYPRVKAGQQVLDELNATITPKKEGEKE